MPIDRSRPGVLGLFGRSGDRIEPVEREEDDRRRRHHAALHAIRAHRLGEAIGHEGLQVGAVERRQCDRHEHAQRNDLQHHQHRIERGAFLGAGHQHAGHQEGDHHRRQVHDAAGVRPGNQCMRQIDSQPLQEPDEIARPAHRHRAHHQRIFQHQAPAHHPGDALAQCGVAVGVGAAGGRHHRGHLRIRQRRAGAHDTGGHKREQHRRAGLVRAHADQRVDAGADDRADAQRDQVWPAQAAHQLPPGLVHGDLIDGFAPEPRRHGDLAGTKRIPECRPTRRSKAIGPRSRDAGHGLWQRGVN